MKIKSLAPLYLLALTLTLQACGGSGAGIIPEPELPGATDGTTDGTTDGGTTDGGTTDGTTDGGTTDGGTTDGGTTDGTTDGGTTDGSTDGGTGVAASVEMIEGFGGALVDGTTFTYPAGSEVWAGFANLNEDIYPFSFANGGSITFTAAVPNGGADTSVYFRFERLPHPDVDPSFNLDAVVISGEAELEYTVIIPAQDAENTYSSFLMYVVEQDSPVMVKDIVVTDDSGSTGGDRGTTDGSTDGGATDGSADGGSTDGGSTDGSTSTGPVEMIEGFGGALVDGTTFTYPAGSEVWAGFANLNENIYPFTFANGGSITFTAAVPNGGDDTSVYFRFERLPHPDVDPSFNLDAVVISGEAELEYTVIIPAQDAENTYSSFLMYVVEQDSPVMVKDIVVTDDGGSTDGGTGGGATDGGSSDGGATDGGTTDGGSTDGGAQEAPIVEMIEGFGGALVDGTTFTYPAGAEVWAGFANLNEDIYPFSFANGGTITFTGAIPTGGSDTSVYFRFERLPHPDVDPSFNLDAVVISGEAEQQYTITIPAQDAENTYSSFLLYVVDQDSPVIVKDIVVSDDNGTTGGGDGSTGGSTDGGATDGGSTDGGSTDGSASTSGPVEMIEGFGGALVDGTTFTYPTGAEVWAGFANLNEDIYPFSFANGGSITFTAAVPNGGDDTSVYFRFERLPHPDVDPSFNLDAVVISGEAELEYTVIIPAQDAENTYSSFLLYVVDQDSPVVVKDIVVTDDNGSTEAAN